MNQEAKAYHSFPARNGCSSGVRAKSCTRQQKRCLQLTQAIENKEPSTYPAVIVTDFVKLPKLGRLQLTIREWLVEHPARPGTEGGQARNVHRRLPIVKRHAVPP